MLIMAHAYFIIRFGEKSTLFVCTDTRKKSAAPAKVNKLLLEPTFRRVIKAVFC